MAVVCGYPKRGYGPQLVDRWNSKFPERKLTISAIRQAVRKAFIRYAELPDKEKRNEGEGSKDARQNKDEDEQGGGGQAG